jgi:hypothetical protein
VPTGVSLIFSGTSPGVPGEVRLCATYFETAATDGVTATLSVSLNNLHRLFRAAGRAFKCSTVVVPIVTFFSPMGTWILGKFCGTNLRPSLLYPPEKSHFIGGSAFIR